MKIFISHKNEDSLIAKKLDAEFKAYGVDTYLDVMDDHITANGKALTEHIKNAMKKCSDIIVVMSEKTSSLRFNSQAAVIFIVPRILPGVFS